MGWSTKQLADLAGVTVRSIRHYHQMGVLADPQRSLNGYKQYQIEDLVRVMQIKRLTSIGMTLAQVKTAFEDPGRGLGMLADLEGEIDAQISRLQAAKSEVVAARELQLRPDVPSILARKFGYDQAESTEELTQLVFFLSQLTDLSSFDVDAIEDVTLGNLDEKFRNLPADAAQDELESLAVALLGELEQYRDVIVASDDGLDGDEVTMFLVNSAVDSYLNEAQRWVLKRVTDELITWVRDERSSNAFGR
jgi:Predicted transcriptional regulators